MDVNGFLNTLLFLRICSMRTTFVLLCFVEDLYKARNKLKETEDTSNLESEQEGAKRKRKLPRKLTYTSSDDESDEECSLLPCPPPIKKTILDEGSDY